MPSSNYLINAGWIFFIASLIITGMEIIHVEFFSVAGIDISFIIPFALSGMYAFAASPDKETKEILSGESEKSDVPAEKEDAAEEESEKESDDSVPIIPKADHLPYSEQVFRQNCQNIGGTVFPVVEAPSTASEMKNGAVNAAVREDVVWWNQEVSLTPPQNDKGTIPEEAEKEWGLAEASPSQESPNKDKGTEVDWADADVIIPPAESEHEMIM